MSDGAQGAKARIAVLISGSGTNMAALLYASRLPGSPYEIVLVASNDPDAAGLALARAEGVPVFSAAHRGLDRAAHEALMDDAIRAADAGFVALAGYMRVLTAGFVERWADRMLNIHPSLLPRYRGLDTHARALAAGDRVAGASVHLVTAELDAGEVLGQARVAVLPGDDAAALAARVLIAEHQLYPRALAAYVTRPFDPGHLLHRCRDLALALPATEERPSHGSPGWRIAGGKYFAHFHHRQHGVPHVALLVRGVTPEEGADLIAEAPERWFRPAYYGASGWIGMILDRRDTDWENVARRLETSWRSVASRRLTSARPKDAER